MSNSSLASMFIPARYYTKGRDGRHIEMITIHHMGAIMTAEQCGKVFQGNRKASAHYGVGINGDIGIQDLMLLPSGSSDGGPDLIPDAVGGIGMKCSAPVCPVFADGLHQTDPGLLDQVLCLGSHQIKDTYLPHYHAAISLQKQFLCVHVLPVADPEQKLLIGQRLQTLLFLLAILLAFLSLLRHSAPIHPDLSKYY